MAKPCCNKPKYAQTAGREFSHPAVFSSGYSGLSVYRGNPADRSSVPSSRINSASASGVAAISSIPFVSPNTKQAVDSASAIMEPSARMVTEANPLRTGSPVLGSKMW